MTDLAEIPIFTSDSSSNGKQSGEKYQPCRQHAPLIIVELLLLLAKLLLLLIFLFINCCLRALSTFRQFQR